MAGQCFWPLWLPGWSRAIAWVALPMPNPMGSEYVCELHVELCSYGYGGTKKKKKRGRQRQDSPLGMELSCPWAPALLLWLCILRISKTVNCCSFIHNRTNASFPHLWEKHSQTNLPQPFNLLSLYSVSRVISLASSKFHKMNQLALLPTEWREGGHLKREEVYV